MKFLDFLDWMTQKHLDWAERVVDRLEMYNGPRGITRLQVWIVWLGIVVIIALWLSGLV